MSTSLTYLTGEGAGITLVVLFVCIIIGTLFLLRSHIKLSNLDDQDTVYVPSDASTKDNPVGNGGNGGWILFIKKCGFVILVLMAQAGY